MAHTTCTHIFLNRITTRYQRWIKAGHVLRVVVDDGHHHEQLQTTQRHSLHYASRGAANKMESGGVLQQDEC